MRTLLAAIASLPLLLAAPAPDASAQDDDVRIERIHVAEGVWMLVGRGGNIGVSAGDDGILLVDDQFAPLTPKIIDALGSLRAGPVRFVLNTHWHGDHTGGNENFAERGALIVAHEQVRQRMRVEQFMEAFDRTVPASPTGALPVVTFDDAVTLHWNGEEIHAFHVEPAHTDGDAVVHFRRANAIHMGDTYFAGRYPFIDLSSGGSVDGVIAAVDRVLALADADTKIIPGHGPLSDRAGLVAYRAMLATVRDRVREAAQGGAGVEEVVAAKPTADLDATWGGGFVKPDDFVRIVHASVAR